jgi:hypothetical protein
MAFTRMSPGYPDGIGAFPQRRKGEFGTHATSARDAYHPGGSWILHAADTGQVGGAIAAPITEKTYYFRFPISHIDTPYL